MTPGDRQEARNACANESANMLESHGRWSGLALMQKKRPAQSSISQPSP